MCNRSIDRIERTATYNSSDPNSVDKNDKLSNNSHILIHTISWLEIFEHAVHRGVELFDR